MQVDWEPGPTEIVPNWAPHLPRSALAQLKEELDVVFNHNMAVAVLAMSPLKAAPVIMGWRRVIAD